MFALCALCRVLCVLCVLCVCQCNRKFQRHHLFNWAPASVEVEAEAEAADQAHW